MSKETLEALEAKLSEAATKVKVHGRYHHFKGNAYTVLEIGINETEEPCVIYQAEYGNHLIFIRRVANWLEEVSLPSGEKVPRFKLIES